MLEIEHLDASYGSLQVLFDVSLRATAGERVGIFGHNGAGKTTLLRACVGAVEQARGHVRFGGRAIVPGQVHVNTRLGLGFVPQGHNIFRELTVAQNLHVAGLRQDPAYRATVFKLFPLLEERREAIAGSLSGGQQQMLALGMALMTRPRVLLLDEPTTGLAPIVVKNMLESIDRINRADGVTTVIVEQNVQETFRHVDRAVVLKSGRVLFDGPSERLRAQDNLWDLF